MLNAHAPHRPSRTGLRGVVGAVALVAAVTTAAPAGAAPPAGSGAAPGYTLTDLGPLEGGTSSSALGIGRDGVAVGTSRTGPAARPQVAVRWDTDGQVVNLGTLPGSTFSRAFAVNARGQAAGEAFTPAPEVSRAVIWEADGTIRDLGTLGGPSAVANDIDASGRVYGASSQLSGPSQATVWEAGGPQALPPVDPQASGSSRVNGASDSGIAVGASPSLVGTQSVGQATRWTVRGPRATATPLDRLEAGGFSTAYGVNERGVAVGEATRLDPTAAAPQRTSTRAVRWDGTRVQELPGLGTYRFTRASDVSARGDAVGFASGFAGFPSIDGAAVLWRDGRAIDLNTVVAGGTDGLVLRSAESINERGQIVGFGTRNGQNRAYLLTPTR